MWEETKQECESGCQCSGLITDAFRINSGNNSTKRKYNEASILNFKSKMLPHSLNFNQSPTPSKRRILGEIQNQVLVSPMEYQYNRSGTASNTTVTSELFKSPAYKSPKRDENASSLLNSPELNSPFIKSNLKRSGKKIRRIFEDRNRYSESVWCLDDDATDMSYPPTVQEDISEQSTLSDVPEQYQLISTHKDVDDDIDLETTMTLSTSDFVFGAPISESERSTNFTHSNRSLFELPSTSDSLQTKEDCLSDIEQSFTFISPMIDENESKLLKFDRFESPEQKKYSFQRQSSVNDYIFMSPIDIGQFGIKTKPGTNKKDDKLKKSLEKENLPAKKSLKFFEDDFSAKKTLKFSETPTKTKTRLSTELSFDSTGSNSLSVSQSPISTKLQTFNSENTTTSIESGFLDEPFLAIEESNSPKLADFGQLLSGPIKNDVTEFKNDATEFKNDATEFKNDATEFKNDATEFKMKRPTFSRSLSYNPVRNRKSFSFADSESPSFRKRSIPETDADSKRPKLLRSSSETDAAVMQALNRATSAPLPLLGDFSRPCALPVVPSAPPAPPLLSAPTLARLLRGGWPGVPRYKIIDCRYPYEYEGGHIQGALNLYTTQQIERMLDEVDETEHTVYVLHCEYSIQRGPTMYRHLRSLDRRRHVSSYPRLSCPEVYLLKGGYRDFYRLFPDLVHPRNYTPEDTHSPA